jgi:hypothetical protein
MAAGKSQFVGTAGQFFVAYGLSVREIHASITLGNAPSVDLMASSADGKRTVAIQVKTSRNAYRRNRYGREGYEWDVSKGVIGKSDESFLYAFVNLQEQDGAFSPEVFFVPSRWVAEFVKPDWSRFMYFLPTTARELTLNRWDLLKAYLESDPEAVAWANSWPEELLVKWGN